MSRLNVWNILGKDVSVQKMMIEIFIVHRIYQV